MPLPKTLNRNLRARARAEESDDEPYSDELEGSSPSILDTGEGDKIVSSDEDTDEDVENLSDDPDDADNVKKQMSNVSFGTLAKAQDTLSRKRKRGSDASAGHEDKLQALRERLREIKESKSRNRSTEEPSSKQKSSRPLADAPASGRVRKEEESEDSDSNDGPRKSRSSKHAPMAQSSKRQVTRRRTVIDNIPKIAHRDPRFDQLSGPVDADKARKNYSFLDTYRADEMNELKAAIKSTKDEEDKQRLKRKLLSMENRKKAQDKKDKEQEVLREHRKKEKALIEQGKQPFYLKKGEQKQLALVEKYKGMKGKQLDHAIERRRKKVASKEKKNMPSARRGAEA
ncbi:hypothetical protein BJ546DRAFT_972296 [Cryomyces antarcticus]|nr:rRNA biogenesis protein rrp36 [Cryomyces antarcticus]KAK5015635.1 rRNA biogenesis protein rrp36 [Cryomyces antarcticus]